MSGFAPYPSYQASEQGWFDQLPTEWRLEPVKYLYKEVNERSQDGSETLLSVSEYYGVKPRKDTLSVDDHISRAESLEGYKKCNSDDLVMNIMLAWKRGLGVSNYQGIVSPAYSVFRLVNSQNEPRYFHYLYRTKLYTDLFKTRSTGVIDSRLRLYPESFGAIHSLLPPSKEQKTIAAFLDYETAKIDQLIAKQQRLIALLKEKRQAVISHAVTKGLNPNAPMKDSGVEWLGEVPEHWTRATVARIVSKIEQGKSPECENRLVDESEWGVLKSGCCNHGVFNELEHKALPRTIPPFEKFSVNTGDVLMSRASGSKELIGSVAHVGRLKHKLLLSDKVFRLVLTNKMRPQYFTMLMSSRSVRQQIELAINGAEGLANNITQESIRNIQLMIPPLADQEDLFQEVDVLRCKLMTLSDKAGDKIQLLKERRSALISAAVTGKIDVRGWVAPAALNTQ